MVSVVVESPKGIVSGLIGWFFHLLLFALRIKFAFANI
jgi:hypothetical protein